MPIMPRRTIRLPQSLEPKAKMRPNEPCWCGSGRKWKKCHKERESAKPLNYFESIQKIEDEFSKGYCSHPDSPDGCGNGIIKSHTIQKSGVLDAISEDRHVMSARGKRSTLHKTEGKLIPQRVGVNSASTFLGFCGPHDTSLFKYIEVSEFNITQKTAFLLTFRAVSYELFAKKSAREAVRQFKFSGSDAGQSLEGQVYIQNYLTDTLTGMDVSMRDLEKWKTDLDIRYKSEDFSNIRMSLTYFDGLLPIVATCAFYPEGDYKGRAIQSLLEEDIESVTFNVLVREGKSIVAFTWHDNSNGRAEKFVRSFEELPDEEKASAVMATCFSHTENWHAKPSWWAGLSPPQQDAVSRYMHFGMPAEGSERPVDALVPNRSPVRIELKPSRTERL